MKHPSLAENVITIIGLGLMGASLGFDLRGHCRHLIGVVRRPQAVAEARAVGCVDTVTDDLASAVSSADIVILATPVGTILRQIDAIAPMLKEGAILTDMGSTKVQICQALAALPDHIQVIGGHPMCGKEQSGLAAAEPGLYQGCIYVLCPLSGTTPQATDLMLQLVRHLHAQPVFLDPERHDLLAATISHLPYISAIALVMVAEQIGKETGDPHVWTLAASGFRDTTRIAGSNEMMMQDILLSNRTQILHTVTYLRHHLDRLAQLIEHDQDQLLPTLQTSASRRRHWQQSRDN